MHLFHSQGQNHVLQPTVLSPPRLSHRLFVPLCHNLLSAPLPFLSAARAGFLQSVKTKTLFPSWVSSYLQSPGILSLWSSLNKERHPVVLRNHFFTPICDFLIRVQWLGHTGPAGALSLVQPSPMAFRTLPLPSGAFPPPSSGSAVFLLRCPGLPMLVENIPSPHGSESPLDPSSDPDMALPLI